MNGGGQLVLFIGAVITGLIIWSMVRARMRAKRAISEVQRRYLVVLLRSSPACFSEAHVESAARSAWLDRFGPNDHDDPFVESSLGEEVFILHARGNAFTVTATSRENRHLTPPDRFYGDSAELWQQHTHDLSVGFAYNLINNPEMLSEYVGRLAAAFGDDSTLGLFHPQTRRLWPWDDEIQRQLREDPRRFFFDEEADARGGATR